MSSRGLALAAIFALGCERAGDRAAEEVAERAIAASGRRSTVEVDRARGEIRIDLGGAIRPSRWPDDVPLYPEARRAKAKHAENAEPGSLALSLQSDEPVASLSGYYERALPESGWTVDPASPGTLTARKEGRRLLARLSGDPDGGSRIDMKVEGGASRSAGGRE